MQNDTLTSRQVRFIEEYPKDRNAKQAAIRAGYSQRSAGDNAWRLLQHPVIRTAIALSAPGALRPDRSRMPAATETTTPERVLSEYARLAFADTDRCPEKLVQARLGAKLEALDALARHFGLFLPPMQVMVERQRKPSRLRPPTPEERARLDAMLDSPPPRLPDPPSRREPGTANIAYRGFF